MGWKGLAIGGCLGSLFGPFGIAFGAALGHEIERHLQGTHGSAARRAGQAFGRAQARQRADCIFCASAAAMLAKLAKADGHVTREEIEAVEAAFRRLGFSSEQREYAVSAFRRAKDDVHSIYEYAQEFAAVMPDVAVREFLYELLWDVACADGLLDARERDMLMRVTAALGIDRAWFSLFARERVRGGRGGRAAPPPPPAEPDPYEVLGVARTAGDDEVKRAYRAKAKKYHPDTLRAQGLPEAMAAKATEMMAKVNAAWDAVCRERGIA